MPSEHRIFIIQSMVLIIDGNSKIGAHVRNHLCYLTCLRHLITTKTVSNRTFSFFLLACATCSELSSIIRTLSEPLLLNVPYPRKRLFLAQLGLKLEEEKIWWKSGKKKNQRKQNVKKVYCFSLIFFFFCQ